MTFEQLVIALLSGTTGAGVLIAAIRLLGPFAQKFVGSVLRTRQELDADRDRIILNLRAGMDDYDKRLKECEDGKTEVREEAAKLQARVDELDVFIDRLLQRTGLDRSSLQEGGVQGQPIPRRPRRRPE